MSFLKRYLIPRIIQYLLVVFLGITAVFFIPRFAPSDPVQATVVALQSRGAFLDPGTLDDTVQALTEMYGLEGTDLQQYAAFWGRVFRGDFGVSFYQFPVRVIDLIKASLPWTLGLLLTTTLLGWTIGNIVGGIAGYYSRNRWSKIVDTFAMIIRPMPYYIFAFALLLIFGYVIPLFPIAGGASLGRLASFTLSYIVDVLRHAFLPALSLVLLGGAAWFQTMKLIVQNVNSESFVQYAKMGGVKEARIVGGYVIRNAMLPQLTALALLMGQILSGALITEIVFSYPGIGTLLYHAIVTGDYNLIMGITSLSILAISTAILVLDLLYPLFDPRVRLI
ncbi:MAG: ABC transporter permease [Spirochaetaceae bacterium]|nr:ABC transporter permease [Spirochaetaceae bacterium]